MLPRLFRCVHHFQPIRRVSGLRNNKVEQPIRLYTFQGANQQYFAYFAGFGQLVFWLSLADMAWSDLKPKTTTESKKGIENDEWEFRIS